MTNISFAKFTFPHLGCTLTEVGNLSWPTCALFPLQTLVFWQTARKTLFVSCADTFAAIFRANNSARCYGDACRDQLLLVIIRQRSTT